jgi:hypothetical protein
MGAALATVAVSGLAAEPGQPAELASIYVQLAANHASYANGQIYGSNGGNGQP